MIYKQFQKLRLSALGLGAMRLPVINGNDEVIDEAAVAEMVACAMKQGVNYYDPAWGYPARVSAACVGASVWFALWTVAEPNFLHDTVNCAFTWDINRFRMFED